MSNFWQYSYVHRYIGLWNYLRTDSAIEFIGWSVVNGYSTFGAGSGSVWMLGPECDGSEENILDCDNSLTHEMDSHEEDVGVMCGE